MCSQVKLLLVRKGRQGKDSVDLVQQQRQWKAVGLASRGSLTARTAVVQVCEDQTEQQRLDAVSLYRERPSVHNGCEPKERAL